MPSVRSEMTTPFDLAVTELLQAWKAHDDLIRTSDGTLSQKLVAWRRLDAARTWVGAFEGAGRQPGWGRVPR